MAGEPHDGTRFSLRRWSRRKLAAARNDKVARTGTVARPATAAPALRAADSAVANGGTAGTGPGVATGALAEAGAAAPRPADGTLARAGPLPPVESLTIDSDFTPFLREGVDENVKRSALRKLLRDPRFNVMDGLDVYIDDYSKPSPIEPELVRTLVQARYLFDPPKTQVNEEGHIEDVRETPEPARAAAGVAAPPAAAESPAGATAPADTAPPSGSAAADPAQGRARERGEP